MTVILLFNLLFRSMSYFRGMRRTAAQMSMLWGSRGWLFFGFRSTRRGKSSACQVLLTWPATGPLIFRLDDHMYSIVQNVVYNVDNAHLKSLDLARESKTF